MPKDKKEIRSEKDAQRDLSEGVRELKQAKFDAYAEYVKERAERDKRYNDALMEAGGDHKKVDGELRK